MKEITTLSFNKDNLVKLALKKLEYWVWEGVIFSNLGKNQNN